MHAPRLSSALVTVLSLSTLLATSACKKGGSSGSGGGGGATSSSDAASATSTSSTGTSMACEGAACEYPSKGLSVSMSPDFEITDATTGRVLPLRADIPSGAGPFPVVVYSHGGAFNENGHHLSQEWGQTLAAQGYVVLHIAHVPPTAETGAKVCELAGIAPADCMPPEDLEDSGFIALFKTFDVVAVLDKLPAISDISVSKGMGALAVDEVGVAGWSGGSRAPLVTMGARFYPIDTSPAPFSHPDNRLKASVALSPIGPGYGGFFETATDNSWKETRGPILVATGAMDLKATKPDLTGEDRRRAYEDQPADVSRWLLYSNLPEGQGGHSTFNLEDLDNPDPAVAGFSRALSSTVRAFLDASILGDEAAKAWLASDNAKTIAGDADWEHK
jgi:hypothetical protein